MAAYPSINQMVTSAETVIDDLQVERASNGALRSRAFFSGKKRSFSVKHIVLATDRATLLTFYDTNRLLSNITFTWKQDGASYTCAFGGPPRVRVLPRGISEVEMLLEEV